MITSFKRIGKSSNGRFMFFYASFNRCLLGYPTIDNANLSGFSLSSCFFNSCVRSDLTCNLCPYEKNSLSL